MFAEYAAIISLSVLVLLSVVISGCITKTHPPIHVVGTILTIYCLFTIANIIVLESFFADALRAKPLNDGFMNARVRALTVVNSQLAACILIMGAVTFLYCATYRDKTGKEEFRRLQIEQTEVVEDDVVSLGFSDDFSAYLNGIDKQ